MIPILFDYATPSVLESTRDQTLVGLAANRRRPVSFRGRLVQNAFLFRVAMRTLGEIIWSSDSWYSLADIFDPIITVHPDALVFEAFSQDQSVYAQLKVHADQFATEGETRYGTTNIDFTSWLWAALGELRTQRETWIRVESEGFEVKTASAGGRFEKKVELPEAWIRGFLNLQQALAIPGTRITARPVDMLAPIRFLRHTKCKVSPRALRYEFEPGHPVRLILEPWEKSFIFKGSEHSHTELRTIRNWGRRRLSLLEPVLPFATDVEVYLKGRSMPSFYVVRLPGMSLTLGLSGYTEHHWTTMESFGATSETAPAEAGLCDQCIALFRTHLLLALTEVEKHLGVPREKATHLLTGLCRRGLLCFDLEARKYRYRELLETPIEEAQIFPPSVRLEKARIRLRENRIQVTGCDIQETRKVHSFKTPEGKLSREVIHRDWQVTGDASGTGPVEIVVKDNSHIIFGRCGCQHFRDHLLSQGPCEEMLALFLASQELRKDLPVSGEPCGPKAPSRRKLKEMSEKESGEGDVDEAEEEEVERE